MHLQDLLLSLEQYWARHGCLVHLPAESADGALLPALGPEPWRAALAHTAPASVTPELHVTLKPSPRDAQERFLDSLGRVGIDPLAHDIRFFADQWDTPALAGDGWRVAADGAEIGRFIYLQQLGGIELWPVTVRMVYDLAPAAALLQGVAELDGASWSPDVTLAQVRRLLGDTGGEAAGDAERVRERAEQFLVARAALGFPLLPADRGAKAAEAFHAHADDGIAAAARAAARAVA